MTTTLTKRATKTMTVGARITVTMTHIMPTRMVLTITMANILLHISQYMNWNRVAKCMRPMGSYSVFAQM